MDQQATPATGERLVTQVLQQNAVALEAADRSLERTSVHSARSVRVLHWLRRKYRLRHDWSTSRSAQIACRRSGESVVDPT